MTALVLKAKAAFQMTSGWWIVPAAIGGGYIWYIIMKTIFT